ncbi:MAG: divergent polysaccharide deacetylase family protein [Rhodospirillaceae bacterium]
MNTRKDLILKALKDPAIRYAALGGAVAGGVVVLGLIIAMGEPGTKPAATPDRQASQIAARPARLAGPAATYLGPEGGTVTVQSMTAIDQPTEPQAAPPKTEVPAEEPVNSKAPAPEPASAPAVAAEVEAAAETPAPDASAAPQPPNPHGHAHEPVETASLPPAEPEPPLVLPEYKGPPRIAIVIDDMGVDRKRSARAVLLPAKVTLSFLPYGGGAQRQAAHAKSRGHEIMLHVAMEPESPEADPGPIVLLTSVPPAELKKSLTWNLDQISGYHGVNNHMGSRFTRNADSMAVVMAELRARGLFFLDSLTSRDSVGGRVARAAGVPFIRRDIFIDHKDERPFVEKQLRRIEAIARKKGIAVAIGHPRDITLNALEAWLPGLEKKGFRLIGVSEALWPQGGPVPTAAVGGSSD